MYLGKYIGKEKDILEYFPMALLSIAMILRSGRSLEEGMKFVAGRLFGRVSLIFAKVLENLPNYQLERCLASVRKASSNRHYQQAMDVMRLYALHHISISGQLTSIARRMQKDAIMERRKHLQWVKESLSMGTGMLLVGVPFIIIVYIITASFGPGGLPADKIRFEISSVYPAMWIYITLLAICYPLLYWRVTFASPVFRSLSLDNLKELFQPDYDSTISDILRNTADMIETGMSLEMALMYAIPTTVRGTDKEESERISKYVRSIRAEGKSFQSMLFALAAIFPSHKFSLTCEFVNQAIKTESSIAETLRLLSETFWSSHLVYLFYRDNLIDRIIWVEAAKLFFMIGLGVLVPVFMPFLMIFLILDFVLYTICLM